MAKSQNEYALDRMNFEQSCTKKNCTEYTCYVLSRSSIRSSSSSISILIVITALTDYTRKRRSQAPWLVLGVNCWYTSNFCLHLPHPTPTTYHLFSTVYVTPKTLAQTFCIFPNVNYFQITFYLPLGERLSKMALNFAHLCSWITTIVSSHRWCDSHFRVKLRHFKRLQLLKNNVQSPKSNFMIWDGYPEN